MAEFVSGSRILQPVAEQIGLPIDQLWAPDGAIKVNVIVVELVALVAAIFYRHYLSHDRVSTETRHAVAMVLGLFFGHFCFGREIFHLGVQSTICFLAMKMVPATIVHCYFWDLPNFNGGGRQSTQKKTYLQVVFMLAMAYLMFVHLKRVFLDVEGYLIDITGPMMLCTLKITVVAFGIHDGCHGDNRFIPTDHRKHVLKAIPSILEFYSYIFYFQGIIVGPPCFFADYKDFVTGKVFTTYSNKKIEDHKPTNATTKNFNQNGNCMQNGGSHISSHCPSPLKPVMYKLIHCVFWFLIHSLISPSFPETQNADDAFAASHNLLYRFIYLDVSLMCARAKYYTAWLLGEVIHNASGFGFRGYSKTGEAQWDLVTSIHPFVVETATSLKIFMDNWNIQTIIWFRYICYNRVTFQPTICTYTLSALWHGCFPGYYVTFINGAIFSKVAKQVRRHIRPYFLSSSSLKRIYDIITMIGTRVTIGYIVVPFVVLSLQSSIAFYRNMYWCLHIIGIVTLFILPLPWQRNKPVQYTKKDPEKDGSLLKG